MRSISIEKMSKRAAPTLLLPGWSRTCARNSGPSLIVPCCNRVSARCGITWSALMVSVVREQNPPTLRFVTTPADAFSTVAPYIYPHPTPQEPACRVQQTRGHQPNRLRSTGSTLVDTHPRSLQSWRSTTQSIPVASTRSPTTWRNASSRKRDRSSKVESHRQWRPPMETLLGAAGESNSSTAETTTAKRYLTRGTARDAASIPTTRLGCPRLRRCRMRRRLSQRR